MSMENLWATASEATFYGSDKDFFREKNFQSIHFVKRQKQPFVGVLQRKIKINNYAFCFLIVLSKKILC